MVDPARFQVPVEALRWRCAPETFGFECTDELSPLQGFVGQDRAIRSLEFGLAVERQGYNIFVTGLTGTGRASAIKAYIEKAVELRKVEQRRHLPYDWCYVYSFNDADRPLALCLPPGQGKIFRSRLEELQAAVRSELTKAFSSEEYQKQRRTLVEEGRSRGQQLIQAVERQALEEGLLLQISPTGVALLPMIEGRPMSPQEYMALAAERRDAFESRQAQIMNRVNEVFEEGRALEKETMERLNALDRGVAETALQRPFQEIAREYHEIPDVVRFLGSLLSFTMERVDLFHRTEEAVPAPPPWAPSPSARERDAALAFQVNVLVDNSGAQGPPIIIEPNPTWSNLFGRIERRAFMGTYVSDHTLLKPGALHLANGGYIVLNARDVLLSPGVWEGLKRASRNKEMRIEDPSEAFGFLVPQGLRPLPIPLDIKIIITGDNLIYQLLSQADEDFWEIFKVKADFDFEIERTPEHLQAYAAFVCACCESDGLLHFDRSAVAKLAEYGARLVADQQRLSSRFGQVKDVLVEADHWARKDASPVVKAAHVQQALEEKVHRLNLIEERLRKLIAEGTIMLDVDGEVVGQVNGLAVLAMGDFSFGKPSRITAKTFMGRRGVINIERESQLSGRIHDKGVLILSGFLGWKYAQDKPLALSASVCFEQSYEGVEGDSASSAELYAILSSLAELPIRQDIAVTGSVNQKGELQPIGGVNEKIEGFYDVCQVMGLTGIQGVIIPHQNVRNLMLREDVVEAVRQGRFHVYAARTIDEGVEALTGIEAGARQADGSYPPGTINHRINERLGALAEGLRGFYGEG